MAELNLDEYNRLEEIRSDSEKIWEERTYQIAVGGLSITFAFYSFLASNKFFVFDYFVVVIWALYAICILINYISHLFTAAICAKIQSVNNDSSLSNKDRGKIIDKLYDRADKYKWFNYIVASILTINITLTIVYTSILFSNL